MTRLSVHVTPVLGEVQLRDGSGAVVAIGLTQENARRLAACWNACQGMTTKQVEALAVPVFEIDRARAQLRAVEANYEAARALLADILAADDAAMAELRAMGVEPGSDPKQLTERIRAYLGPDARMDAEGRVYTLARAAVETAARNGQVLTITQRPRLPLAMGNYETVVEVRPARGAA